jgi:hypothetical protein
MITYDYPKAPMSTNELEPQADYSQTPIRTHQPEPTYEPTHEPTQGGQNILTKLSLSVVGVHRYYGWSRLS